MKSNHVVLIFYAILVATAVIGAPYYLLSQGARVRSELHPWFRSSGYVGQTLGIGAFLAFLFLWLYPLRKRVRALAFTGGIARWLNAHIAAGMVIPAMVILHAGWRFSGLAGVAAWCMLIVALSGFIGRYLYTRIPRGRSGLEMNREEIRAGSRALLGELSIATGLSPAALQEGLGGEILPYSGLNVVQTFRRLIMDDLGRRRAIRRFRATLREARLEGRPLDEKALGRAMRLARQGVALEQQLAMLEATRKVFGYWHTAHLPFAITALAAVVVHVVVVIAVGATWIR